MMESLKVRACSLGANKGQSLIEIVAALGIILLILTGVITATTFSIKSSRFSKTQSMATKYANEMNEWIRSQRDTTSWTEFRDSRSSLDPGTTYCFNDTPTSWPSSGLCPGYALKSMFKRQATLINEGGAQNKITIKIEVEWQDESGIHKSELETFLTEW